MSWYEPLIAAFTFDNPPLLVAAGITFGFGFWEYIYSFRLTSREGRSPFPVWMHTFYFAHDSSWAVILMLAAARHDWNWFLVGASVALMVWTAFEVYNLTMAVRLEREEAFASSLGAGVTPKAALVAIVVQVVAFYALVNLLIAFMGAGSFLQWAALTNVVMAVGPALLSLRRRSRTGGGLGVACVILLGTVNTFLPTGMFVLALPQVFDTTWFYVAGVVFSAVAAAHVVMVARYPAKERVPGQRRPIW